MAKAARKSRVQRDPDSDGPFAPLARPPFQLDSLPARFRWEATRRHPYYLTSWLVVRSAHRHEPLANQREELTRLFGIQLVRLIGVSGEPLDPAITFDELGADELHSAMLTGSVQPLTLRQLAGLLIDSLPHEVLGSIGLRLCKAACSEPADPPHRVLAQMELATMGRELDAFPIQPYVWVNPAASSRQVSRDIAALLKSWKTQYGLKERRERSEQDYLNYLRVWDLREGWTGSGYDGSRERTLRSIAVDLKTPLATVTSQYKSAFEMVTGHPYSPETWFRVFCFLKFSALWSAIPGWISRRRPQESKRRREIPETMLQPGQSAQRSGLVTATAEPDLKDNAEVAHLLSDLRTLFDKGRSDAQIAAELELSDAMIEYLPQLRERFLS